MPFVAEQFYKLVGVVRMDGNDGLRLKLAQYLTHAIHIAMSTGMEIFIITLAVA